MESLTYKLLISLMLFPVTIFPYIYIRVFKKSSVTDFRENIVLTTFRTELRPDEQILIASDNGSYSNMLIYLTSIPISLLIPVVFDYPLLPWFVLLSFIPAWAWNISRMVTNYCSRIIVTNRSLYVYDYLHRKTTAIPFDRITSVASIGIMRATEIEVNGRRVCPNLEVENPSDIVDKVRKLIANTKDQCSNVNASM